MSERKIILLFVLLAFLLGNEFICAVATVAETYANSRASFPRFAPWTRDQGHQMEPLEIPCLVDRVIAFCGAPSSTRDSYCGTLLKHQLQKPSNYQVLS